MAWLGTKKRKTAIAAILILLLALVAWLLPHWLRPGYAFQAEVVIDSTWSTNQIHAHMMVYVNSGRWLIHHDWQTNGTDYQEDAFDGKYTYSYLQFTPNPAVKPGNTSVGTIGTNDIPDLAGSTDWTTAVWLAYASARYFDTVKGDKMKSFFYYNRPTPEYDQGPWMQADWTRSTNAPFLPTYVFSKKVGFRYQVLQFTNFAGLQIPSEFVLDSMHGRLVKISRLAGSPDFRPKLDGVTSTYDHRFPDRRFPGMPDAYLNTDFYWHTVKPTFGQRIKKQWILWRKKWFH